MPNRIIKENITTSANIDHLSWEAEVFFYRLIVSCDDFGRMDGRAVVLLAKCFPLRIGRIKEKDVTGWIDELVRGDFVYLYSNGHNTFLQITSWEKHQQKRANHSKYPSPDDDGYHLISIDINCNQVITDSFENREARIERREPRVEKRGYAPSVSLTQDEYEKLVDKFGESGAKERIERLSLYKQSKGVRYKSDYATILNWAKKDEGKPQQRSAFEICQQIARGEA
jgi:hypothetical protein